jgi:sulfoxide reductase heme-binding subunit YedZ
MLAFLLLVPLAVTSTNGMVKRLGGKNWARLHKLSYAIAILGVIHFWMIVKSDVFYPALFGLALAVLLGYRVMKSGALALRTGNGRIPRGDESAG